MQIKGVRIAAIAAAVPKNIQKLSQIEAFTEGQAEKFSRVTGITERRIATENMYVSDLIAAACKRLFHDNNLEPKDVGLFVAITQSGDNAAPGVALKVSCMMGLPQNHLAFDINLGCSSFPYGLSIVASMLRSLNIAKGVLCIGDISSRLCYPADLSTYPLFGDAGSAILIEKTSDPCDVLSFDLNSDGSGRTDIFVEAGGLASMSPPLNLFANAKTPAHMQLKGANVFSFAIDKAPKSIKALMSRFSLEEPDICVLHQANKKINKFIEAELGFQKCAFPETLTSFGNTSSVTIPLTLVANYGGTILNQNMVACGFGVGLSWGAVHTSLNNCKISDLVEV